MRFNPLWFLVFLLFISGMGIFLLPLLLILAVFGCLLMTGFSVAGLIALPRRLWRLFTDTRTRANYALCHSTLRLLKERTGIALNGYGTLTGYLVENTSDENAVYEAAMQAHARLKSGETKLVIYPESRTFRVLACLILAVVIALLLSGLGFAGIILALIGGWFAAPVLSPWLQGALLSKSGFNVLSIQSASFRRQTLSSFGGRLSSVEAGVEVFTSASDTIEAEIVYE